MTYVVTVLNITVLGVVAYLFFNFRKAVDTSGVRQVDDYLHELEGSVAQLTEQFERTSTKISKDLLGKATELQALIGECDAKLAEMSRIRTMPLPEPPVLAPADPAPASTQPLQAAPASPPPVEAEPVTGINTVSPAVAARRMSAAELLATRSAARPRQASPAGATEPTDAGAPASAAATAADQVLPQVSQPAVAAQADSRPAPPSVAGPQEKYRLIFLLASEGMETASIAKHTNLTRGEVEMLLDLRRQGKI